MRGTRTLLSSLLAMVLALTGSVFIGADPSYEQASKIAGVTKDLALGAYGKTLPGALTGPMLDQLGDAAIDQLLDKPKGPPGYDVGDASNDDALTARGTYDYLRAYEQVHGRIPDDAQGFADDDGSWRDWSQIRDLDELRVYGGERVSGYIGENGYEPANRFDDAALSPDGSNHAEEVDGYLSGRK